MNYKKGAKNPVRFQVGENSKLFFYDQGRIITEELSLKKALKLQSDSKLVEIESSLDPL